MSALRFHHVFFVLMLLALVSAFAIKPEQSGKAAPQLEKLFSPITAPLRAIGSAVSGHFRKPDYVDPRSDRAIRDENEELRVANASLQAQLDALKQLNADRADLGQARKESLPVSVIGVDAGTREAISIGGSSLQGVKVDQAVIYTGGIVGRVVQAGIGGAKVQLITDAGGQPLIGTFGRFQNMADGQLEFARLAAPALQAAVVHGGGDNSMIVDTVKMQDAAEVQPQDLVVLNDPSWPPNLQGYKLGTVVEKSPRPDSPLYARIVIKPATRLKELKDVSVVVK